VQHLIIMVVDTTTFYALSLSRVILI